MITQLCVEGFGSTLVSALRWYRPPNPGSFFVFATAGTPNLTLCSQAHRISLHEHLPQCSPFLTSRCSSCIWTHKRTQVPESSGEKQVPCQPFNAFNALQSVLISNAPPFTLKHAHTCHAPMPRRERYQSCCRPFRGDVISCLCLGFAALPTRNSNLYLDCAFVTCHLVLGLNRQSLREVLACAKEMMEVLRPDSVDRLKPCCFCLKTEV